VTSKVRGKKITKQNSSRPKSVEAFVASLDEASKPAVNALREIFLAADPGVAEGIKWNVPSFRTSDYFATMNLRVKTGIGVVLHFGAKKSDVSRTGVEIPDPASLLVWLAKDRAMITFRDMDDIIARRSAFTQIIREWIKHVE
jgi:hypothetical protein